jgi:hypothetical protein
LFYVLILFIQHILIHCCHFTGNILNSSDAALFPVLPFVLLQQVLDKHSLDSEKGAVIRQQAVDMGVLQLLLACLAVFTQQVTSANVAIPCK